MDIRITALTILHYNGTAEVEIELFTQNGPVTEITKRLIVNIPGRYINMADPELLVAITAVLTQYAYL